MKLTVILLATGGALGTLARYGVNGWISRGSGLATTFPLGTMVANVSGCFVIGVLAALTGSMIGPHRQRLQEFIMIGFCGGYTTFSSFGIQSINLAADGEWTAVGLNVIGSNLLGLAAVYLGLVCGRLVLVQFRGGT